MRLWLAAAILLTACSAAPKAKPNPYAVLGGFDFTRIDPKLRDAVMKATLERMIDDDKFRRDGQADCRRLLGTRRWVELQSKLILDAHPGLANRPVIWRAIRRRLH